MTNETVNANVQQATETFKKLVVEQNARIEKMTEEMAKIEAKGMDQMRTAIEEATRLMKSSLDYQAQLSAELRKMALEATRRATEMLTPRA